MAMIRKPWWNIFRRGGGQAEKPPSAAEPATVQQPPSLDLDIPANDPLVAYLLSVSNVVELDRLKLESPTLRRLKAAGVKMVAPLISQGELVGMLNLGPRRSEQEYSADDRRLLNTLAAQAAPALRVAQMARQQQAEARERERLAQELRVARVIQETLLPREIPALPGWQMAAHWQPARAVSGDFYDFLRFPDGRLAIIVGDVTDKGVPAALVMATTRSTLRAATEQLVSPGAVLEHANNILCPDIPPNMFVTCLYALLDPVKKTLTIANAGHNLPYIRGAGGVVELRARGMPLGLMPEMRYEETEITLTTGDQVIFYSDGLVEAHNHFGEMFGFPRLREILSGAECASEMIPCLVNALAEFTGPGWEQEDDVTFLSLACVAPPRREPEAALPVEHFPSGEGVNGDYRLLAEFSVASQPGNERQAMERVGDLALSAGLAPSRVERLKTAVAEATMNAMEHGNQYRPDLPVAIFVLASAAGLLVRIRDNGANAAAGDTPASPEEPDLDAKLAGLQSPRGWGLFLIRNMVDDMRVSSDEQHHMVELFIALEGEGK